MLTVEQVPVPAVQPDEALIRVRACALNHLDLWFRAGQPGRHVTMPRIPGADMAGEVAATGSLVRHLQPGQRVVVNPGIACGTCHHCLLGNEHLCLDFAVLGGVRDGGYAQYVAVPGRNVLPMPDRLSFAEAAAVPLTFLTAWHMLVNRANGRVGETAFVWAAGSGVGSAAVQVAKLLGMTVITSVGTPAKVGPARALGADHVLLHHTDDVVDQVRRLTGGQGADVVVDTVGQATWERSLDMLSDGGRYTIAGSTTGQAAQIRINIFHNRQIEVMGSTMGRPGELSAVLRHVQAGRLRPVVDQVMPLFDAALAHERMETSSHFGKIVLVPPDDGETH